MRTSSSCRALRGATWSLLAALVACSQTSDDMSWARTALERNDQLEIVAEDRDARTFTVRMKDSNELKVVRADELSAAVPQARAPAAGAQEQQPAEDSPEARPPDAAVPNATSRAEPVEQGDEAQASAEPAPVAASGEGRVIASGPGYSIQASDREAPNATARAGDAPASSATERRTEPLVCQGARFMHIDGRSIAFTGDAIIAEDGCELFITNSHIAAGGVGLAVRGGSVHIKNSTVEGKSGALHASGNAQVYTQASRFRGMVRRLDDAVMHDMGQNVWN